MKAVFRFLRRGSKAGAFSPTAFALRATVIAVLYGVSELLGLREYTTFLSGTSANLNLTWQTAAVLGFILLAPICLITAGLLAVRNRWVK